MSVKYSLALMKNPMRGDEPKKYYAKAQGAGNLDIERICKAISHAGTSTRGDVLVVSDGLIHEMVEGLSDGMIVELGDFGHFQVQLSSEGTVNKEDFSSSYIRKPKIQFRPGPMLISMLKTLKYEQVAKLPVKEKEEDVKP